ncbi:MAG: 13E12 repeat family protein [Actinomycetota bacterium]|nr:13E12 repeat family protein [Actinomycetota bacterium]
MEAQDWNPDFVAEWEAMSEVEYTASLRFERQVSWAAAGQFRAVAELARRRVAARGQEELAFFVDEIALALTCSRYAAWSRLHTALNLVDRLPDTLAALGTGRICVARARVIAEGTRALSDDAAALVQDEVLAAAGMLTPARLRAQVAAAVAAVDPARMTRRMRRRVRLGRCGSIRVNMG